MKDAKEWEGAEGMFTAETAEEAEARHSYPRVCVLRHLGDMKDAEGLEGAEGMFTAETAEGAEARPS
jgi:hypothetical protein